MKKILSIIIILMAVCSFSFAAICTTQFSGTIASDGTGAPGAALSVPLETGCACGVLNSMTIAVADLGANCNDWYLYDVTYDGTGGTTLTSVCAAALTSLALPLDATTVSIVQYDCCGDGVGDNTAITIDILYDFTDDGTCPSANPPSCLDPTPICADQGLSFPASTDEADASTTNPNVGYDCLNSQPNPEWFYLEIAVGGTLNLDISNSAANDIDWAAWGPFTSYTEMTTNCASGAGSFDIPVDCDFTINGSGTIALGTVSAGSVYAILVTNFNNTATDITIATAVGSTASTDCSIVGGGTNCAATCTDAATNGCNVFVTPTDTPPTTYTEIQVGGGESCFFPSVDVSITPVTVVQCFNYTHNTPGSTEFSVLNGASMTELNDTDGIPECEFTIDQIEFFDAACNSIGFGGGLGSVSQGSSFTICVSVTGNNGIAEGDCVLNCLANAITPITPTGTECAATCADASTNACNVFITNVDTPPTTYGEIQAGGGESCLLSPIDVSTTSGTITQCFNYTHSTPGSSEFDVLVGNSMTELNDTDGINECNFVIDQIEFFDGITCASIGIGGGLTGVPQGASYTICVTATGDNGTAEGNCTLDCLANAITPFTTANTDCAPTCAAASTNSCNHFETAIDTPVGSYTEIQTGGGESCFTNAIDVTNAPASVTQCFTYTHTAVGSDGFGVISGLAISELNDTNGTNDCGLTIDSIEIFDQTSCTSFGSGPQGVTISPVAIGDQFTICVTGTADNGTAEGNCSFECMAHSVTPISPTNTDCAPTCADASTNSCNHFETAIDTPVGSYTEIQTGGGESCFTNAIDVTNAPASVTQCFTYTHTAVGSDGFGVISGLAISELNDTNGTNDCGLTIDSIEIFDQTSCTSFGSGPQGVTISPVAIGDQFTICVTGTANNGTAEGNCSFECMAHSVTPISSVVVGECANNCAAVDTAACNVFITPADTPPTTYGDIQTGGGESCFVTPIDVSTTPATVTQCFEYTHNTPGSSEFAILSGVGTVENNDTDGINECDFTIDNIEIFDEACISFGSGSGLTSAIQGVTYTICVTATANNGTAEGDCSFECMANAVTPITAVCDEVFAFTADDKCSGEAIDLIQNAGCDAGPGNIDLDFYVYAPGSVAQEAPAGYDPFQGSTSDNNYPISNTDLIAIGGVGPSWGNTICDDGIGVATITNSSCGPAVVSIFVLTWDRAYDTDVDSVFGEYNTLSCTTQQYDVTIYPASLQTEVTNDGSTCGLPQVVLVAADSTVCETITGSQCSTDGDVLNYDFSTTATAVALANAPAACALPVLTGTITCAGCTGTEDDCATLIADGTNICSVIVDGLGNLDPTHPLATQDCDNGGIDNYTECLSGEDPSDPLDDCTAAVDESVDICALIGGGSSDLIITGVGDGPLNGGTPKFMELYVVNNIADLSIYGIESTNNGVGTVGVEYSFPAVAAAAGSYIYVASSTVEFTNWFGFAPDYATIAININGDDAVALYENFVVVDVFGDVNVDGTGTAWEYTDGFAYRANNTGPSTTFNIGEWTFSGIDAWDGEITNATATTPFPTGTFTAGGGMLGGADCDGDGVTNADECADSTDPLDPCSYEDGSVTGPVTADQSGCACPDLSPILNLLPNNISGASNINVIAEITELGGVDTDGSTIRVRLPSDPRLAFTYDPTLTNIGFNSVNNADWNYVGNNGVVHEFTYIPAVLSMNARTAFGYIGTYDPQATDGQTTLTVTIVPFSGGECVFTNNTDAETLIYFD